MHEYYFTCRVVRLARAVSKLCYSLFYTGVDEETVETRGWFCYHPRFFAVTAVRNSKSWLSVITRKEEPWFAVTAIPGANCCCVNTWYLLRGTYVWSPYYILRSISYEKDEMRVFALEPRIRFNEVTNGRGKKGPFLNCTGYDKSCTGMYIYTSSTYLRVGVDVLLLSRWFDVWWLAASWMNFDTSTAVVTLGLPPLAIRGKWCIIHTAPPLRSLY